MEFPFAKKVFYEKETEEIAEQFAAGLSPGDVVLLNGKLGTGKTFFVKSVCRIFNIENVSSPSFSIVNEYAGKYKIYHLDFYRVTKATELEDIGFDDYLNEEDSIIFIEWADMFVNLLPKKHFRINFQLLENGQREISISGN